MNNQLMIPVQGFNSTIEALISENILLYRQQSSMKRNWRSKKDIQSLYLLVVFKKMRITQKLLKEAKGKKTLVSIRAKHIS